MLLTYENDRGILNFYGSGDHEFSICEISGLEPMEKNRTLQTYIGEDGKYEDTSQYPQRIITLSGDIKISDNSYESIRRAARILAHKGTLTIENEGHIKIITVNSASLTIGKRYNTYMTFAVQMTCDYPNFTDGTVNELFLFRRIDHLAHNSSLPIMLTGRISEGILDNTGDINVYPIITVTKISDSPQASEITVENRTTGKSIVLARAIALGESIVIDIKNREITSSISGSIMGSLSLYSRLSDIRLGCGENELAVSIGGNQDGITVEVAYENEYVEAI